MFCGDDAFFLSWRKVTARYGLIVNEEKTGRSRRYLELNSQVADYRGLISKPVLSFLRLDRQEPGSMLRSVITGMSSFARSHQLAVVTEMRHEIALRGVREDLGSLGPWWRDQLIKKRWFRESAIFGGCPLKESGVKRGVEVTIGPPPREKFLPFVTRAAAQLQRDNTDEWTGVRVVPYKGRLDRERYAVDRRRMPKEHALRQFRWVGMRWAFVWPRALYERFRDWPIFYRTETKWLQDHPFLTTRPRVEEVKTARRDYPPTVDLLIRCDNLPRMI
jgi:hypothetical protein